MNQIEYSENGSLQMKYNNLPYGPEANIDTENNNRYSTPAKQRNISGTMQNTPSASKKLVRFAGKVEYPGDTPNHSNKSSQSTDGKLPISIHAGDVFRKSRAQNIVFNPFSLKNNSHQRTLPQKIQSPLELSGVCLHDKYATESSSTLINKKPKLIQSVDESTSLAVNRGYSHQVPRRKEIHDIKERVSPQNITKKLQKSTIKSPKKDIKRKIQTPGEDSSYIAYQPNHISEQSNGELSSNNFDKKEQPQTYMNTNQSSQSPNRKPILIGLFLKDPCTKEQFFRKSVAQEPQTSTNTSSTVEHLSCLLNQPVQFSDESPNGQTSIPAYTDYIIKDLRIQELTNKGPSNSPDQRYCPQNILQNTPSVVQNSSSLTNKSTCSCKFSYEEQIPTHVRDLSDRNPRIEETIVGKTTTENNSIRQNLVHEINTKRPPVIQNSRNIVDKSFQPSKNSSDSVHEEINETKNKPNKTEEVKKSNDDENNGKCNDNDVNSNRNNEYYETLKKKPKYSCPYVLPPEYDPNDTRWTLKHRKAGPGIIELTPQSHVYIDARRFEYCKENAKDCNELARMLLTEIFSLSALRVCSLTGTKTTSVYIRPGLDKIARERLLTFIQEYGGQRWGQFHEKSVENSLRNKIYDLRSKHAQ